MCRHVHATIKQATPPNGPPPPPPTHPHIPCLSVLPYTGAEADRLLGTALAWFEDAVAARPWDSTVVTAHAYHLCNSIRDPTTLNDVTTQEYIQLWCVASVCPCVVRSCALGLPSLPTC